jgi:hypothetical protein
VWKPAEAIMIRKPRSTPPGNPSAPGWIKPLSSASPGGRRIDIADTPAKAAFKLVEGDRDAAEACIAMVKAVATVDPDAEFGPFTPLLILESIGLTGQAIAAVYTHVCGGDVACALAVLHAARLKLVTVEALKRAAAGRTPINTAVLLDAIRSKMPRFAR